MPRLDNKPLLTQAVDDLEELAALLAVEIERLRLVCVECSARSDMAARGWRVYLTTDDEPATYCPECAEAEFDG